MMRDRYSFMLWISAWLSVTGIGLGVFYDRVTALVPAPLAALLFATWLAYALIVTRFFELWCMRNRCKRQQQLDRQSAVAGNRFTQALIAE